MQMRDICERKGESVPRNLLKTMCTCAGNGNIRLLAARKMDSWLLNGKVCVFSNDDNTALEM